MPALSRAFLAVLAAVVSLSQAFYLPGVAPVEYADGASVNLKVNKLTSSKTQLPYRYYVLPVCQPTVIKPKVENLGEILMGDAIENSPYELKMNVNTTCQELCSIKLTEEQKDKFRSMIEDWYMVNWLIDNLPASTRYSQNGKTVVMNGFPLGSEENGRYYIHNHVKLRVMFHQNKDKYEGSRVVGFEVVPSSRKTCTSKESFDVDTKGKIGYYYDVEWVYSDTRWASRWDSYLQMTSGGEIHWFSILNSFVIMLLLSGMVAIILLRTLHRDIASYNETVTKEEAAEETGWKLVHGDVFRAPENAQLLCATVGSGVQLLGMSIVTVFFAGLGFLSPAHRGGLLQSMMLLFTFMGILAGYTAARLFRTINGENWKTVTFLTACLYPAFFFGIFFFLNLLIWHEASSGAVPFATMFALLVLWFGISVPLVFLGAYFGFRHEPIALPVRTNTIARAIPEQHWAYGPLPISLTCGLLPFGAVFTELFFIMSSLWQHQFYYLFGFLILTLLILIVTCAEISITVTYFQLTTENHAWWWRAFLASAGSGFYVFVYSVIYFHQRLQIEKTVSTMLYFGYMAIASTIFVLITGSIGLLASFQFVRGIYGSIKVD